MNPANPPNPDAPRPAPTGSVENLAKYLTFIHPRSEIFTVKGTLELERLGNPKMICTPPDAPVFPLSRTNRNSWRAHMVHTAIHRFYKNHESGLPKFPEMVAQLNATLAEIGIRGADFRDLEYNAIVSHLHQQGYLDRAGAPVGVAAGGNKHGASPEAGAEGGINPDAGPEAGAGNAGSSIV